MTEWDSLVKVGEIGYKLLISTSRVQLKKHNLASNFVFEQAFSQTIKKAIPTGVFFQDRSQLIIMAPINFNIGQRFDEEKRGFLDSRSSHWGKNLSFAEKSLIGFFAFGIQVVQPENALTNYISFHRSPGDNVIEPEEM